MNSQIKMLNNYNVIMLNNYNEINQNLLSSPLS